MGTKGLYPWKGELTMHRAVLASKIHRATVTDANLNYNGSITVDQALLDAAGMYEYELVQIVNVTTGARFETYTISGPANSGTICLNGAAARLVHKGDLVIIMAYRFIIEGVENVPTPRVVLVDDNNHIIEVRK